MRKEKRDCCATSSVEAATLKTNDDNGDTQKNSSSLLFFLLFLFLQLLLVSAAVAALVGYALATDINATSPQAIADSLYGQASALQAARAGAVNQTLQAFDVAVKGAVKAKCGRAGYQQNPPLLFVPGLFGSYLTITATPAACAALPQCVAVNMSEPAFITRLTTGPVLINDFISSKPLTGAQKRVELLVALLTQTYNAQANTLNYLPGVSVATFKGSANAYCDGVSKTYIDGIIKYFIDKAGYVIGKSLACVPYNWELDMPGLGPAGYFDLFASQISALFNRPANDPPVPGMPRKKVLVVGHSMGTLFATSALQELPQLNSMVQEVLLVSPVAAGAALTWQLTTYGGFEPALPLASSMRTFFDDALTKEEKIALNDVLRYLLWSLGQIGAVNPTLAPYDLPPYAFKRLMPPTYGNGFPPATTVAIAGDTLDPLRTPITVTVATQRNALQGPNALFRTLGGSSVVDYLDAIWPRSHSYDQTVVFWSSQAATPPPANITITCAYGVNVTSIVTSVMKSPVPFPASQADGFKLIVPQQAEQTYGPGDGVVNLQGNNGCNRMADNTGGLAFTCESQDCEHIKMIENKPGSRAFLDTVMPTLGVNISPTLKQQLCAWAQQG